MKEEDPQLSIARLLAAGRAQAGRADLEATLRHLLALARRMVGARFAALALVDKTLNRVSLLLTSGPEVHLDSTLDGSADGKSLSLEQTLLRLTTLHRLRGAASAATNGSPDRAAVISPIVLAGEVTGVLCVVSRESEDEFTESHRRLLDILATWTAFAFDQAQLRDDLASSARDSERAARQLFGARDVAAALGRTTNPAALLDHIAGRTRELARAHSALVWLLCRGRLVLHAVAGVSTDRTPGQELPVSGHASVVLVCGQPLHSKVDRGGALIRGEATRSLSDDQATLLVPMMVSTTPIGILVAAGSGDRTLFSESDQRRVVRFAAGAAAAVVLSLAGPREELLATPSVADKSDGSDDSPISASLSANSADILVGLRMLLAHAPRVPQLP